MKAWDESMGEISGFGGGYEAVCRAMVLAGIKWIDEHPKAEPKFAGYKGVFGLITANNRHADQLTTAMMNAPVFLNGKKIQDKVRDDCTGAMHHAAVRHCLAYKALGWDAYRAKLIANKGST